MKTNKNNTPFPIVGMREVIDLFHTVAYWRCADKEAQGHAPHHRWVTFDFAVKVLNISHVLPERRIDTLRGNKEFFKLFLSRTAVIPQTDLRGLVDILDGEKRFPFMVRISDREIVSGYSVDPRDLFGLRRIFLTARGMAAGSVAERAVARLITRADYESAWNRLTAKPVPGVAFAVRSMQYAAWLKGDEEET